MAQFLIRKQNQEKQKYITEMNSDPKFLKMLDQHEKDVAAQAEEEKRSESNPCYMPKDEISGTTRVALDAYIKVNFSWHSSKFSLESNFLKKFRIFFILPLGFMNFLQPKNFKDFTHSIFTIANSEGSFQLE